MSHYGVGLIVGGTDEDEARSNANDALDSITGDSREFDYGHIDHDWEELPTGPVRLDTELGRQLVEDGWRATVMDFMRDLAYVRANLARHTDIEVMEECCIGHPPCDYFTRTRHQFHTIGRYGGPGIYLYDSDGSGLRTRNALAKALWNWQERPESLPKVRRAIQENRPARRFRLNDSTEGTAVAEPEPAILLPGDEIEIWPAKDDMWICMADVHS